MDVNSHSLSNRKFTVGERTKIPIYTDHLPPCNKTCPAGENIQEWLSLVQAKQYEAAFRVLTADNPFPAIHGRVCYHTCENACNRKHFDAPVSIHSVERYLGDLALENKWALSAPNKELPFKILVIGAGPSGLSAAYQLRRMGCQVTIKEAGPMPGGMMNFGIPRYRLPRSVMMAEIQRILDLGVKLELNTKVDDLEKTRAGYDAVFIAIGAHLSKKTDIPATDTKAILGAVEFLASMEKDASPQISRRVAVYGGGNTAMDAARTAKRLGAEEVIIVYRRDKNHMPAHHFELEEAEEEGIKVHWLRTITKMDESSLTVEVMELDDKGRPQPTGKFETLDADSLILAIGQDVDLDFLRKVPGLEFNKDNTLKVNTQLMTSVQGIFAGGDMVPSDRTVTIATGHGKKAAKHIFEYLNSKHHSIHDKHPDIPFEDLRLWYYSQAQQKGQSKINMEKRTTTFDEVLQGLDAEAANFEAWRCLSCGNCFECDGCYGACPESAVIKLGPGKRYQFNYDKCTGCGACFEQCPCGAIDFETENKTTSSTIQ